MDKALARLLVHTLTAAVFAAGALEDFCRRYYPGAEDDSWAHQAHRIHQLLLEAERRAGALLQEIE